MKCVAQLMRFGNQDFFRLVGRDPVEHPMTRLEQAIILTCIAEQVEAEYTPREPKTPAADDWSASG